jgi:short-subunit dehydrogenase
LSRNEFDWNESSRHRLNEQGAKRQFVSMPETVVITGASAGVGRALVREFARHGCNIGLLARDKDRLDRAAAEADRAGVKALAIACDVADARNVGAAADRFETELGPIAVWVNNAMATIFSPVDQIEPEEFRRVTEVTYLGQVYGTMAALKHMRRRDRGTIVQVGSALSYRAIPLQSAYCGAKFAIRGFTNSLRSELLHEGSGIRLTMVQLPAVNTPQFEWARNRLQGRVRPLPPVYQPEAIAREIVRAAREAPRELWIGYPSLKAIISTMLLPGLGDRILARRGYSGQISKAPKSDRQDDNLFSPVRGEVGARGPFSASAQDEVRGANPRWLRAAAALTLIGALGCALTLGRSTRLHS